MARESLRLTLLASIAALAATRQLTVATAQLAERDSFANGIARICSFIGEASQAGAQVVVFPEAALTGYGAERVARVAPDDLAAAEDAVCAACRRHSIAAIVGTARDGYNSALVVDADGSALCRQHKMMLVPTDLPWARPGDTLHVFTLCGAPCSVMVERGDGRDGVGAAMRGRERERGGVCG